MAADPADPLRALVPRYDLVLTYGGGPPVVEAYRRLRSARLHPGLQRPRSHDPPPGVAGPPFRLRPRLPRQPPAGPRGAGEGVPVPARPRRSRSAPSCWAATAGRPGSLPNNVRPLGHVSTARPQRLQLHAAGGAQRQPRQHGPLRPLSRHPPLRGRGGRRLPGERRLGRHRRLSGAGAGGAAGRATATRWPPCSRRSNPERARAIGQAALRRVLAEHTYEHRADQVEAILEGRSLPAEVMA